MSYCRICCRTVDRACLTDAMAQTAPRCRHLPETFVVGDVAYITEAHDRDSYSVGDRATVDRLLPPTGNLQPVHVTLEGRDGHYYLHTISLSHLPVLPVPRRPTVGDRLGTTAPGVAAIEQDYARAEAEQARRSVDMEARRTAATARFTSPELRGEAVLAANREQFHDCGMCGQRVSAPCRDLTAAAGCTLPARVLRESGWHNGGVSGRDFPPAVRELCAAHQRRLTRLAVRTPSQPPRGQGFGVRDASGNIDVDTVATAAHACMVTFLVARCGYRPEALTEDHSTTLDAWQNGPAQEGWTVVPVIVAEGIASLQAAECRHLENAPPAPVAPPGPPQPRRRAIRTAPRETA